MNPIQPNDRGRQSSRMVLTSDFWRLTVMLTLAFVGGLGFASNQTGNPLFVYLKFLCPFDLGQSSIVEKLDDKSENLQDR